MRRRYVDFDIRASTAAAFYTGTVSADMAFGHILALLQIVIGCLVWLAVNTLAMRSVAEVKHVTTSDVVDLFVEVSSHGQPCLLVHGKERTQVAIRIRRIGILLILLRTKNGLSFSGLSRSEGL